MVIATIDADAGQVRSLGRSWKAMAHAARNQGALVSRAVEQSDVCAGTGSADNHARAYVEALTAATETMAAAYSRVAGRAPDVAAAFEAANAAEQARDRAAEQLAAANALVGSAESALMVANAAVATQRAAGAISILIGMHLGPSAAQLAALAQAERRLEQARQQRDVARAALNIAQTRVDQAGHERCREARTFAAVCRAEAEVARTALPTDLPPPGDAPQFDGLLDGLAALASVASGQALAIARFAKGGAGAASSALEIADRWAKRLERYGSAAALAAPAIDAAMEAFADHASAEVCH